MPLLPLSEIQQMSPIFRGMVGGALAGRVMHLLSMDRLNALYDRHAHLCGPDFARSVLLDLGVGYEVMGEVLPGISSFITISNHPYGVLDGIVLADLFGHFCPDYKIMVNRILGRVKALSSSFIAVTPIGPTRSTSALDNIGGIKHALTHLRQGGALGLFPSGAVSDLHLCPYGISDRAWPISIVRLIAHAQVPIIPVHFLDRNSLFYYALGLIDWRVRLLRLPAELFNKSHHPTRLVIGPAISTEEQKEYLAAHTTDEFGLWLRSKVYDIF